MNYEELEIEVLGKVYKHIILDLGDGNVKTFLADESNPEYLNFLEQLDE
jgi:hypothetical protein